MPRQSAAVHAGTLIAEAVPVLLAYIDSDVRYRFTNAAYRDWLGASTDEHDGQKVRDVIGDDAFAAVAPHIETALAGKRTAFEGRLEYQEAGPRDVHIEYFPDRDDQGEVGGFFVVIRDISDLLARRERLRKREAQVEKLVNTTQDGVVFIDAAAEIVRFNAAAEEMFGYTAKELIGQKVNVLMPDPYASEHDGYLERYESGGRASEGNEQTELLGRIRMVQGKRKDGTVFPIEVSVSELLTEGGAQYAAVIRDVSEKVRLQQELIERERLAAVGTTTAKLAHEIGNPLNNLYLHIQLVKRRLARLRVRDTDALESLELAISEVRRLSGLLNEFRSLSRRPELDFNVLDVRDLLDQILLLVQPDLVESKIEVISELPTESLKIWADDARLKQVLLNIIKNAIEAMPTGGCIRLSARYAASCTELLISDDGPGLDPTIGVFDPFTTTKADGTGLGLPIARQIIEAHDGNISYETAPGEGTTFVICLPAAPPPKSELSR